MVTINAKSSNLMQSLTRHSRLRETMRSSTTVTLVIIPLLLYGWMLLLVLQNLAP